MFINFDPTYLWCVLIPTLIISVGVQVYLKSTFSKWSKVRNHVNMNGMQVGQSLYNRTTLDPVPLEPTRGSLTDHFDPGNNVVRLSEPVATQASVASMAVCAHELGHVQQYQTGSALISMRGFLLPALRFSPTLSYIAILAGLWFSLTGLIWLGIIFFAVMVLFSILTLPVEIDASRRGLKLLREANLLQDEQDAKGARNMLTAAGLTYLAAAVTSILQLLYYISLAQRRS